jgi:hypothetical protein
MSDNVKNPTHYNAGKIEAIDIIDDWELGFYEGNILKYLLRYPYKGTPIQDLEKAMWYLSRLIDTKKNLKNQ